MTDSTTPGRFRRYDHVERLGHPEVRGLTAGRVYVFPKLDGTNGSAWVDEAGDVRCASRNRILSPDADNHGFCAWVLSDDATAVGLRAALAHPGREGWIIYGELMIPHTLKTYREDVWRKFWIFDVYDRGLGRYLAYDEYRESLEVAGLNFIEPLCTIQSPSEEQIRVQVETNTYLVADGAGLGEGVVVKRYDWKNDRGRQPWAKVVRNEFKERNRPEGDGPRQVEMEIAEALCTPALVGKTRARVVADVANERGIDLVADPNARSEVEHVHRHKVIPQLLGRVFHDLVTEEAWTIVKKWRSPVVNFKLLQACVTIKIKEYAEDLF